MKIEHVALYVEDLEKSKAFLNTISKRRQEHSTTIRKPTFAPIF